MVNSSGFVTERWQVYRTKEMTLNYWHYEERSQTYIKTKMNEKSKPNGCECVSLPTLVEYHLRDDFHRVNHILDFLLCFVFRPRKDSEHLLRWRLPSLTMAAKTGQKKNKKSIRKIGNELPAPIFASACMNMMVSISSMARLLCPVSIILSALLILQMNVSHPWHGANKCRIL